MAGATNRLRAIFDAAAEIESPDERQAYLAQACGADAVLRAKVEKLLRSEASAGGFLADPKREMSASIIEKEGDRIGRYKLLERIGEGGCGVVYLAEQTEPVRRRVALKIIKLGMDTRSVVARFEAERQALALMDHPSIAQVLDAGATDTGRPFFVMELVRGIRITDYCEQHNLVLPARLQLFSQVCQAVQHAHQKGIIHRDLKPSNILVTSNDGVPLPKVIDFGIAKATSDVQLTDKTLFTRDDLFLGTPAYMSPEQAEFNARDVDTRTDVYSLGVLLYELLTGSTPFDAKELISSGIDGIRKTIREREPLRPSTRLTQKLLNADPRLRSKLEIQNLKSQIHSDLDWIVLRALEKDRNRRYQTATDFAADIQRHLNHEPVIARPPSPLYLFGKLVRRNRPAFVVASAAALLLVAGVLFIVRDAVRTRQAEVVQRELREKAEQAKGEAETANRQLTRELFLREWQDAEHLLEQGKVGSALAWFARAVRAHPDDVAARTRLLAILTERMFALPADRPLAHGAPVKSALLTSDGTHLVTAAADNRVRIWPLDLDTAPKILPETFTDPRVAIVAPNNHVLVQDSESVSLWELDGTRVRNIRLRRHSSHHVSTTSDGRFALLTAESGPQLWDTAELRPVGQPVPIEKLVEWSLSANGQHLFGSMTYSSGFGAWSASSGKLIWEVNLPELPGASDWSGMAYDPKSGRLALGRWAQSANVNELFVWNLKSETGGLLRPSSPSLTLSARLRSGISALAFSPSGDRLFLGDLEGGLGCVNLATGELETLSGEHDGRIWFLSFPGNGQRLATASADGTARLWDVRMRSPEPRIWTNGFSTWDAKFSPDSRWFVMTGLGAAEVRETATGALRHRLSLEGLVTHLNFSPDGKRIVACSSGGEARVWDAQTGAPVIEPLHGPPSHYVAFSADGRLFCVVSSQNTVTLSETETGRSAGSIMTNNSTGVSALFSRDSRHLFVATASGELEFWSVEGTRLERSVRHKDVIWTTRFSPDERLLLTASRDRTAALWEAETGRLVREFRHEQQVLTAAFSPDGKRILTGDGSRRAFIWDAATGQRLIELMPHPGAAWYGEFSTDGRLILTGDDAGNARLWDAASGLPLSGWVRNGLSLKRTHLSPDGRWALSAAEDGTVRVWPVLVAPLPAPAWLPELAEALAGRRLREDKAPEAVPDAHWPKLSASLSALEGEDFYARWARWFLVERMKDKPSDFVP